MSLTSVITKFKTRLLLPAASSAKRVREKLLLVSRSRGKAKVTTPVPLTVKRGSSGSMVTS